MSTSATQVMQDAADDWEALPDYPSAVCSGIKGDDNHPSGYHISYNDNPSGNYSITRSQDKPPDMPNENKSDASAIDMSMSTSDMAKSYKNWKRLYDNHSDPRRKYFNAVNCYSGSGDARRLDFRANTNTVATSDHKWHEHCEWHRKYARSQDARRAYISIAMGQTVGEWEVDETSIARKVLTYDEGDVDPDYGVRNRPWREDALTNTHVQTRFAFEDTWDHVHRIEDVVNAVTATLATVVSTLNALVAKVDEIVTEDQETVNAATAEALRAGADAIDPE